jgi:branched-chain amino acid transport system ATP-binding protein
MTEPILVTQGLSRRFGGLMAVNDVAIGLDTGMLHAVLGPNGAGKTTLINLLSGELPASAGNIRYKGEDITRLSPDRRSRLGIGRSFQKTNIFPAFTAFENCRLAAQSRIPRALHVASDAVAFPPVRDAAQLALAAAGLAARGEQVASTLSHGEQRQLEIAMVLATAPEVLLLDEPLAGMGAEEVARMVELLKRITRDHALLLVEHDMDAVFAVADRITVMVNGQVLESGTPNEIRASPAVRQAIWAARYERATAMSAAVPPQGANSSPSGAAQRPSRSMRPQAWGTPGEAILEARKLHAYYGASHILHGIDFRIGRGETVGLMGRNGMGRAR